MPVDALVLDRQRDAVVDRPGSQTQRAAARGVAHGVGGEVLQRLLEAIAIAGDLLRARLDRRSPATTPAGLGGALVPRGDAAEQIGDRHVPDLQRSAAAVEPRQVEQFADQPLQPVAFRR